MSKAWWFAFMLSLSFLAFSIILVWSNLTFFDGKLHVVFCDVGQGDGIFIRTPKGLDILIDAGPNNGRIEKCLSSHMPFYDKEIELVIATHPDADHIGGYASVLADYKVDVYQTINLDKTTGIFAEIERLIKAKNIPRKYIGRGEVAKVSDGVAIKTFWPDEAALELAKQNDTTVDVNSFSLVQTITYVDFSYLATADINFENLNRLLPEIANASSSKIGKVDVFKLPHHGSHTGINEETFNLFLPKISIISAGLHNRYGHPHESVLSELKKYQLKYLRTDIGGEIEIVTDGKTFEVRN